MNIQKLKEEIELVEALVQLHSQTTETNEEDKIKKQIIKEKLIKALIQARKTTAAMEQAL